MGDPDHGDLSDTVDVDDLGLDLGGVDVHASGDDHVVLAVEQVQEAVGVEPADVSGEQPSVAQRAGRGVGSVVVADHRVLGRRDDLTDLADRDGFTGIVDDADFGHRDGLATTGQAVDEFGVGAVVFSTEPSDEVRRLGLAVELHEHRAEDGEPLAQAVDGDRGGAVENGAEGRQVERTTFGCVEDPVDHRRNHEGERDLVFGDAPEAELGIELVLEEDGGASDEAGLEVEAGAVGQRRHEQHALVVEQAGLDDVGVEVERQLALAVHDALGLPGRAAGVDDQTQVVF